MASAPEAITEALDHLMEVQEQHGAMLTGLEQRPLVDLASLTRRLEDLADVLEPRGPLVSEAEYRGCAWRFVSVLVLGGMLLGYGTCWMTARYLPTGGLPPGFSRPVVERAKGTW